MRARRGIYPISGANSTFAPSRSWMLAGHGHSVDPSQGSDDTMACASGTFLASVEAAPLVRSSSPTGYPTSPHEAEDGGRQRPAPAPDRGVPSSRHRRKEVQTVPHGGRSCGRRRQGHPVCSTDSRPLTTSRRSTERGQPPGFGGGRRGSRTADWASVRSEGEAWRGMPQPTSPTSHTVS